MLEIVTFGCRFTSIAAPAFGLKEMEKKNHIGQKMKQTQFGRTSGSGLKNTKWQRDEETTAKTELQIDWVNREDPIMDGERWLDTGEP